ncbi:MAG TPA: thiamine pyrophosphate-binding protein, partial [Candidatus Bathyarchaeota archaeon]|nr:thiamine pyrophosphate-binding protein [Candidatus Bathyarchaeota archaeon]
MKASRLLLEMLRGYEVSHVFGLPGETTLPLYEEWLDFPEIRHVVARDERSASFMAEGYAKFSFKPGVCEAPSVGATHVLPGCAEAYKGATPIVFLVSDIPLDLEPRNMLTGLDQSSLFSGITKESLTLVKPQQVSHLVRRAFRVATTGRPGPVHMRLPMDVLGREAGGAVLPPQSEYASYPGARPVADPQAVFEALRLLGEAERPVLVCGQGVLLSQAWDEVVGLAEAFAVPVGTTINGKGGFPEGHPL